jgi:hypothetical protein
VLLLLLLVVEVVLGVGMLAAVVGMVKFVVGGMGGLTVGVEKFWEVEWPIVVPACCWGVSCPTGTPFCFCFTGVSEVNSAGAVYEPLARKRRWRKNLICCAVRVGWRTPYTSNFPLFDIVFG